MFAQVYIAAILAVFAQSIFAHTCSRTYTVKAGDYCDKISQEQNVSTFQLAVVNLHVINKGCSNLTENQPLCLGTVGEDCSITHVVQPNDTCTDIAAQNNLNKTILYLNNPQLDESCDIYVGEVLCTSNTVQVPAIPASGITFTVGSDPVSTIIPNKGPSPTPIVPSPTPIVPSPSPIVPSPSPIVASLTPIADPPAHTVTPTIEHTTPSAPKATDKPDNGDDSGDDNLPFCDEL